MKTVVQVSLDFKALQKINALTNGLEKRGLVSRVVGKMISEYGTINLKGMSDLDLMDLKMDVEAELKARATKTASTVPGGS